MRRGFVQILTYSRLFIQHGPYLLMGMRGEMFYSKKGDSGECGECGGVSAMRQAWIVDVRIIFFVTCDDRMEGRVKLWMKFDLAYR